MSPPSTLRFLERPWSDAVQEDAAASGTAFLMGLRYPGPYWVELAIQWAEQGCPLNAEAVHELQRIADSSSKQFAQQVRHRAAAVLRLPRGGVAAQPVAPADGFDVAELALQGLPRSSSQTNS